MNVRRLAVVRDVHDVMTAGSFCALDVRIVGAVFESALSLVISELRRRPPEEERGDVLAAVRFLHDLVAHGAFAFTQDYAMDLARLYRTGWDACLGALVERILRRADTHVAFLVQLDRWGALGALMQRAFVAHRTDPTWDGARAALRAAWPERVPALGDDDGNKGTEAACPITLCGMRHPVVASDGHTYERDALLRHMVAAGATSPVTRGRLAYDLYPNRALSTAVGEASKPIPWAL